MPFPTEYVAAYLAASIKRGGKKYTARITNQYDSTRASTKSAEPIRSRSTRPFIPIDDYQSPPTRGCLEQHTCQKIGAISDLQAFLDGRMMGRPGPAGGGFHPQSIYFAHRYIWCREQPSIPFSALAATEGILGKFVSTPTMLVSTWKPGRLSWFQSAYH